MPDHTARAEHAAVQYASEGESPMTKRATMSSHTSRDAAEAVTIRMAVPGDAAALRRLAELDSAPASKPVPMLLAEVDGELRAALPLEGGRAIADPFRRTAELVAILTERARQLAPPRARRTARRWRPFPAPTAAPPTRAWATRWE
jgi:hypothetical protein